MKLTKSDKNILSWLIGAIILTAVCIKYPDKADIVARALLLFFTGI